MGCADVGTIGAEDGRGGADRDVFPEVSGSGASGPEVARVTTPVNASECEVVRVSTLMSGPREWPGVLAWVLATSCERLDESRT